VGRGYTVQVQKDNVQHMKIKKEELITDLEDEEPTSEEYVPSPEDIREELERRIFGRPLSKTEDTQSEVSPAADWDEELIDDDDDDEDYIPYKRKRGTMQRWGKRKKGLLNTESDDEDLMKLGAVEQLLDRHRKKEITRCMERVQPGSSSDIKLLKTIKRDRIIEEGMDFKDAIIMKDNIEENEVRFEDELIRQGEEKGFSSGSPKKEMVSHAHVNEAAVFVSCWPYSKMEIVSRVEEEVG